MFVRGESCDLFPFEDIVFPEGDELSYDAVDSCVGGLGGSWASVFFCGDGYG